MAGKTDGRFYLLVQTAVIILTFEPAEPLRQDLQFYEVVM